jgi:tRNA nucleotidyltransferase (CCA-adding enzyme)
MTLTPPAVPPAVRALAEAIDRAGGRAYLVGGGVRDHLTGHPVKDWDLEVFGLPADELERVLQRLGRLNAVGRSFGVFKWTPRGGADHEIDVSIPRRDSKVGPGHKGIAVEGDPAMPPVEAARRRDLTINAMMWDLLGAKLEDPWRGLDDLRDRRLRAVDRDTFLEDPLRALRVVQFAARLEFEPDAALVELGRVAALDELPAERVNGEWSKLLLKGRRPSLGMRFARDAGILDRVFPEVAAVRTDADLDALVPIRDRLAPEGRQWTLMAGGWLHPAPETAVVATLDRLGVHTIRGYPVRDRLLAALRALDAPARTDSDLRRLSTATEILVTLELRRVVRAEDVDQALARAGELGITDQALPRLLLGRHLKSLEVPPGPRMGQLLAAVYEEQLDGAVADLDQAKEAARRWLAEHPER